MWWTLVAATVGSLTALTIAFLAYPWQKAKDRHQLLKSEKREAYRRFSEEANGYFARCALGIKIEEGPELQEHYIRVVAVSSDLIVYAPKEVIEACQKYSQRLFEFSDFMGSVRKLPGYEVQDFTQEDKLKLYSEVKRARRRAMVSIRIDLNENDEAEANEAVNAFFVLTSDDEVIK
jgi:hypothetical protein